MTTQEPKKSKKNIFIALGLLILGTILFVMVNNYEMILVSLIMSFLCLLYIHIFLIAFFEKHQGRKDINLFLYFIMFLFTCILFYAIVYVGGKTFVGYMFDQETYFGFYLLIFGISFEVLFYAYLGYFALSIINHLSKGHQKLLAIKSYIKKPLSIFIIAWIVLFDVRSLGKTISIFNGFRNDEVLKMSDRSSVMIPSTRKIHSIIGEAGEMAYNNWIRITIYGEELNEK